MVNYWCYRIDARKIEYLNKELNYERLRQGWGWDIKQDLRNLKMDMGAKRNMSMFNKVKKGDILLVPRIPDWGKVAVVEATEDWSVGYRFEIDEQIGEYGHIFPAKYIMNFTRHNKHVSGNIRSTLRNPSRFWNINHYSDDVIQILNVKDDSLIERQDHESRMISVIGEVFYNSFDEERFTNELYEKLNKQFTSEEWEFVLVKGLKELFPFYSVERTGGKEEKNHGTDILIKLPSIVEGFEYAIAIQVKDYNGFVNDDVINQINMADKYWESENLKLIEKWVIITKSEKKDNLELINKDSSVKIIFANEFKELLKNIGKSMIGLS